MQRIGFGAGKSFDFHKADATVKRAIEQAPNAGQTLPAPKGSFDLTLRLHAARAQALNSHWKTSSVERVEGWGGDPSRAENNLLDVLLGWS
jgi:hypothetical protein